MLSYRHAFHAGNHADVLKHFCTVFLLRYLCLKETALSYIDTHAGAGLYALQSTEAKKNEEFSSGIAQLWARRDLPSAVADYVDCVRAFNYDSRLLHYPGSPWIAQQILRSQDRLRLFELHPRDVKLLADSFKTVQSKGRILIHRDDGFANLKALLPTASRRALVLIDPSYEVKKDYQKVVEVLSDALVRFPTGCYTIWHPILQRIESRNFIDKLKRLQMNSAVHVTLRTKMPMPDGFGFSSSGMFVINPPYTFLPMLKEEMPWLVKALAEDDQAGFTIEAIGGR